jgi:hypothetical protein
MREKTVNPAIRPRKSKIGLTGIDFNLDSKPLSLSRAIELERLPSPSNIKENTIIEIVTEPLAAGRFDLETLASRVRQMSASSAIGQIIVPTNTAFIRKNPFKVLVKVADTCFILICLLHFLFC